MVAMTIQPRPNNPIERRKAAVRRYSRNAVLSVGGGLGGGLVLAMLTSSLTWLVIGLIVAVVGGYHSWSRIQKIVNHRDQY